MNHQNYGDAHPFIIMFGEKSEEKLLKALDYVEKLGYTSHVFREPDRNNEVTAFTTDILPDRVKEFKKFQLLK